MKTNRRALTIHRVRLLTVLVLLGFVTLGGAALAKQVGARWGQFMPRHPMMPLVTPPSWAL